MAMGYGSKNYINYINVRRQCKPKIGGSYDHTKNEQNL